MLRDIRDDYHSPEDFASDESFQNMVLGNSRSDQLFWSQYQKANQHKHHEIEEAKELVRLFDGLLAAPVA